MHIVFYSVYPNYNQNNALFRNLQSDIGDDLLSPFIHLDKKAAEGNHIFSTIDQVQLEKINAIVFVELPKKKDAFFIKAQTLGLPLYLITLESPIIMPENYISSNHKLFRKVFTWKDDLIRQGDSRYVKINYSFNLDRDVPITQKASKKLLTLIAGNKISRHPNELYSARQNVINYMEKYHPNQFDFYGFGWDSFIFGNSLPERILNKLKISRRLLGRQFKTYRGPVVRKNAVLSKYAFSLCFENAKHISGYITEKIFDCFFAGCVPIYLGADNITDYIPKNCFIDYRDFASFDEIYAFITQMSQSDYSQIQQNIQNFLKSDQARAFSNECFASTVLNEILAA